MDKTALAGGLFTGQDPLGKKRHLVTIMAASFLGLEQPHQANAQHTYPSCLLELSWAQFSLFSLHIFLQNSTNFKNSHVVHSSYRDCVWNLKQPWENASLGSGFGLKCGGRGKGILAGAPAWAKVWRQGLRWTRSERPWNPCWTCGTSPHRPWERLAFQDLAQITDSE